MTEQAKSSIGVMLLKNGVPIAELMTPTPPTATGDVQDTSAQNNIGGIRTKDVGWIDHGNMTFSVNFFASTDQNALVDEIYDRTYSNWAIVMPPSFDDGATSYKWVGQIAVCSPIIDGETPVKYDMEVTVSGPMSRINTASTGLTTPFFVVKDTEAIPNTLTPSPAAAGGVYEYTVEAYSDNTEIKVTPTATAGTIYVNGVVVATGAESGAITLNTGTGAVTMVSVTVTELNKTPKVYWMRIVLGTAATP
jgi:hypothetical protein